MKIVHHHINGCFDWLISEYQSVNTSREAIAILSGKYKRFTFVHSVSTVIIILLINNSGGVLPISHNALDRIIYAIFPPFCQIIQRCSQAWKSDIDDLFDCTSLGV